MSVRYTTKSYSERVTRETHGEYAFFGEYKGVHRYGSYYHTVCGQVTKIRPVEFFNAKSNTRCRWCLTRRQSKTADWFVHEVKSLVGDTYEVLTDYTRAKNKVSMKHKECGYVWKVTPDNFLRRNSRCPKCNKNARLDNKGFIEYMSMVLGDEYRVDGNYVNMHVKIRMTHLSCGNTWEVEPSSLVQGTRCPKCSSSKGEKLVESVLSSYKVNFTAQKRFEDCRYILPLPFDFYLPDINTLIEYDGEQHYRPVDFNGSGMESAERLFRLGKVRDGIKNKYAKDNGITLLRIPYWLNDEEVIDLVKGIIS